MGDLSSSSVESCPGPADALVVHAAAGAAGLDILVQTWSEEKKRG